MLHSTSLLRYQYCKMNKMQQCVASYLFSGEFLNTANQFYTLVIILPAEVSSESSNSYAFVVEYFR